MIEENINHDTCHVTISRGPCSPQQAHPLVCYSLLPLPAPAAISSIRADPGNCFSLCKMKRRWQRTTEVRTNAQRLGLPEVHRLPAVRYFLPQQQSRSVCPPWPCWRLPVPKCSINHLWSLPFLSVRDKTAGKREREGNLWVFTSYLGYENTLPALLGVRSRSLWSKLFSCPDLSAWESLHIFERCALSPAL